MYNSSTSPSSSSRSAESISLLNSDSDSDSDVAGPSSTVTRELTITSSGYLSGEIYELEEISIDEEELSPLERLNNALQIKFHAQPPYTEQIASHFMSLAADGLLEKYLQVPIQEDLFEGLIARLADKAVNPLGLARLDISPQVEIIFYQQFVNELPVFAQERLLVRWYERCISFLAPRLITNQGSLHDTLLQAINRLRVQSNKNKRTHTKESNAIIKEIAEEKNITLEDWYNQLIHAFHLAIWRQFSDIRRDSSRYQLFEQFHNKNISIQVVDVKKQSKSSSLLQALEHEDIEAIQTQLRKEPMLIKHSISKKEQFIQLFYLLPLTDIEVLNLEEYSPWIKLYESKLLPLLALMASLHELYIDDKVDESTYLNLKIILSLLPDCHVFSSLRYDAVNKKDMREQQWVNIERHIDSVFVTVQEGFNVYQFCRGFEDIPHRNSWQESAAREIKTLLPMTRGNQYFLAIDAYERMEQAVREFFSYDGRYEPLLLQLVGRIHREKLFSHIKENDAKEIEEFQYHLGYYYIHRFKLLEHYIEAYIKSLLQVVFFKKFMPSAINHAMRTGIVQTISRLIRENNEPFMSSYPHVMADISNISFATGVVNELVSLYRSKTADISSFLIELYSILDENSSDPKMDISEQIRTLSHMAIEKILEEETQDCRRLSHALKRYFELINRLDHVHLGGVYSKAFCSFMDERWSEAKVELEARKRQTEDHDSQEQLILGAVPILNYFVSRMNERAIHIIFAYLGSSVGRVLFFSSMQDATLPLLKYLYHKDVFKPSLEEILNQLKILLRTAQYRTFRWLYHQCITKDNNLIKAMREELQIDVINSLSFLAMVTFYRNLNKQERKTFIVESMLVISRCGRQDLVVKLSRLSLFDDSGVDITQIVDSDENNILMRAIYSKSRDLAQFYIQEYIILSAGKTKENDNIAHLLIQYELGALLFFLPNQSQLFPYELWSQKNNNGETPLALAINLWYENRADREKAQYYVICISDIINKEKNIRVHELSEGTLERLSLVLPQCDTVISLVFSGVNFTSVEKLVSIFQMRGLRSVDLSAMRLSHEDLCLLNQRLQQQPQPRHFLQQVILSNNPLKRVGAEQAIAIAERLNIPTLALDNTDIFLLKRGNALPMNFIKYTYSSNQIASFWAKRTIVADSSISLESRILTYYNIDKTISTNDGMIAFVCYNQDKYALLLEYISPYAQYRLYTVTANEKAPGCVQIACDEVDMAILNLKGELQNYWVVEKSMISHIRSQMQQPGVVARQNGKDISYDVCCQILEVLDLKRENYLSKLSPK